jgi:hypothetical protein
MKMKNLSSDELYYKSFALLIIWPIAIAIFIKVFWTESFSHNVVIMSYIILGIFTVYQWYRWSKCKRVLFDNNNLLIKTYFTNKTIQVPITSVCKISKAFSLAKREARTLYNITFIYDGKKRNISFFKAPELYNIDDLDTYIRSKN